MIIQNNNNNNNFKYFNFILNFFLKFMIKRAYFSLFFSQPHDTLKVLYPTPPPLLLALRHTAVAKAFLNTIINRTLPHLYFADEHIGDAADDRYEIEEVPRISKVILQKQISLNFNRHLDFHCKSQYNSTCNFILVPTCSFHWFIRLVHLKPDNRKL